jgi:signal transduction histidine kinase
MPVYPVPANESARIQKPREYGILDSEPDPLFDDLSTAAAVICETPVAYISLIDDQRQWIKSSIGAELTSTPRCDAICSHTIAHGGIMEICDLAKDTRFEGNPFVASGPRIRFYAGAPLLAEGNLAMGSLCVVDLEPRTLTPRQRSGLAALSRQAVALLNLHRNYARLADLSRQKDDFLRIASHDLKNPLQAILMGAATINDVAPPGTVLTERHARVVTGIRRSAKAMQRIIADYLDFQAIEDGRLRIAKEPTDLARLAREAIEDQAAYAEGKRIRLRAELAEAAQAHADPMRISQVMNNLLGNAIKFSPPETEVAVCVEREAERTCFRVRDAGPGIKDEDRPKLFMKYARLGNKPTGGEKSSGLGLAICKSLIEQHGGEIGAENNPDRGTTFFFRIAAQGD